jgi:hypothetical protein
MKLVRYKLILGTLVLACCFDQVKAFFTYAELAATAAVTIPTTVILSYYLKYKKLASRTNPEAVAEAQNRLEIAKLDFQSHLDIVEKISPDLSEDQRSILEIRLLKKIVSNFNRSWRWPFHLYEKSIATTYKELKQHLTWLQERSVKNLETKVDSADNLPKTVQELVSFINRLATLREVMINSSLYRIIHSLPCSYQNWP